MALTLLATLFLVGCAPSVQTVGGIERKEPFTRGVSLSPSTTELLASTAMAPQALVGRTANCNFPPVALNQVPVVMNGIKPDLEKITAAKPQVILYDKALYSESDVEPLKATGAQILGLDSSTLAGYRQFLRELATQVGSEQGISDYLDKVRAATDKHKTALTGSALTVMFILEPTGAAMAAGTEGFHADIARELGVTPVGPKGTKFMAINAEEIIRLNPSVIFTTAGNVEPLLKDPRFATLKAVQKQAVYGINPDVFLRAGSRVDALIDAIGAQLSRNR